MANTTQFECIILDKELDLADFQLSAYDMGLPSDLPISIRQTCLHSGKEAGSRVITLTLGQSIIRLVPTRAMALLDVQQDGIFYGWDSPVKDVVHPSFINLEASNGLGWLDGFNEMMARCGYQWTGHPGQDGDEFLTLHGRIQNTPASNIKLIVELEPPYQMQLIAQVSEKRFKSTNFELETCLTTCLTPSLLKGDLKNKLNTPPAYLKITDTLTNKGAYPREYQVIYHNNFAAPILEEGSQLLVPMAEISPFNEHAISGLDDWHTMPAPTAHFEEIVFNIRPLADDKGVSYALMHNKASDLGIEVSFNTHTLPVLTIWKNTDLIEHGYVVGIEPGTSFAYNRGLQRELGLVPTLGAGQSVSFEMTFCFLTHSDAVLSSTKRINTLQATQSPMIKKVPLVNLIKH